MSGCTQHDEAWAIVMCAKRAWRLHDGESCPYVSASQHRFSSSRQNNEKRTSAGWPDKLQRIQNDADQTATTSTLKTHRYPLSQSSPTSSCYLLESFLKYSLFIAVACAISNTVSPTPRKRSARERKVGSEILFVSMLYSSGLTSENEKR